MKKFFYSTIFTLSIFNLVFFIGNLNGMILEQQFPPYNESNFDTCEQIYYKQNFYPKNSNTGIIEGQTEIIFHVKDSDPDSDNISVVDYEKDPYNFGIGDEELNNWGDSIRNYNPTIETLNRFVSNPEQITEQNIRYIIRFIFSQAIKQHLNNQEANLIVGFFEKLNTNNINLEKIYDQLLIFYLKDIKNNGRYFHYISADLNSFIKKYFNCLIKKIIKTENLQSICINGINNQTNEILKSELLNKITEEIIPNPQLLNRIFNFIKLKAEKHLLDEREINTILQFLADKNLNIKFLNQLYEQIVFLIYDKTHLRFDNNIHDWQKGDYSEHFLASFKHELLKLIAILNQQIKN
ncbi:MAG: hypothetical protein WC436_01095 [Candidatus Babeliales bacterium]